MAQTIRAEMVASVHSVLMAEGDAVVIGDTLVILESMKMEIPVESPCDGVIVALHVVPEESVQEGQLLLELRRNQ